MWSDGSSPHLSPLDPPLTLYFIGDFPDHSTYLKPLFSLSAAELLPQQLFRRQGFGGKI